jgi:hypothetical protein
MPAGFGGSFPQPWLRASPDARSLPATEIRNVADDIPEFPPPSPLANLAFEIERMRASIPDGGNAADVARELVERLAELQAPHDVVEVLRHGLAARQALLELGLKIA